MLQPNKKKLNPAQKTRVTTSKNKSKTPASYDVDWDAVRSVNDNVAVQTAKMFDPTGISSYPDVYYAAKDLSEGKGSWGELGLNILGALPMVGKAKVAFRLAKASRASKTIKNTKKTIKVVEEVASKLNKVTNPAKIKPLLKAKSIVSSSKQIGKSDIKNVAIDLLDIANVSADATSVIKKVPDAAKQTVENTKKVIDKAEKLLETPSPIDKKKVIQYYNTDPNRGEVEKPGQLADVQYVPVSNSEQLEKWKSQKLAYGTGAEGLQLPEMFTEMFQTDPQETPAQKAAREAREARIAERAKLVAIQKAKNAARLAPIEAAQQGRFETWRNSDVNNVNRTYADWQAELAKAQEGAPTWMEVDGKNTSKDLKRADKADAVTGFGILGRLNPIKPGCIYTNEDKSGVSKKAFGTGVEGIGDPPNRLTFENELMSKVITERNKDKNFVQRALNPSDYSKIINEDGSETTHLMQYSTDDNGNAYVSPTVIQNELGLLSQLTPREAMKYGRKSGEEIKIPDVQLAEYYTENGLIKHGYGTNSQGIMKTKMNPRKKYGNGTPGGGIGASNYIESPAETMNNYDIMLAKASSEAMNNPWLPVVSIVGGLAQQAVQFGAAGGFKKGAFKKEAAMGMNNVQQDVEVEGGEMYETPQGQVGEFEGASHEQGGIPLEIGQDVEEGTKVYSDRLKVGKKTLAERKATRERQIANLEKQASQPNIDQAVKNALQRKMAAIQKEEQMDLQFQGQVDQMQQMADMAVQAFAFGTSMEGIQDNPIGDSMRYGYGTTANGIQKYGNGTTINGIQYDKNGNPIIGFAEGFGVNSSGYTGDQYNESPVDRLFNANKALEDYLNSDTHKKAGSALDNVINKTEADTKSMVETGKLPSVNTTVTPGLVTPSTTNSVVNTGMQTPQTGSNFKFNSIDTSALNLKVPNVAEDALNSLKPKDPFALKGAGDAWANKKENQLPEGVVDTSVPDSIDYQSENFPNFKSDTTTEEQKGPSRFNRILSKLGENAPGLGDITKLVGNYMGMTAGIKGAYNQRASDITHKNVFAKAGEDALKAIEGMQASIEGQKAQALVNNTTQQRTATKSANNSTRSVNTKRAMNWLYDTAATTAANEIVKNTQAQIAQLGQTKTGILMNRDQMKGQGEYQANIANESAKDAFNTALTKGNIQFAEGLMQTGDDLNSMRENKMKWKMKKNSGTYVQGEDDGTLSSKDIVYTDESGKKFTMSREQFKKLIKEQQKKSKLT